MCPVKSFNDVLIENTKLTIPQLSEKIFNLNKEIAIYITKFFISAALPVYINCGILIIVCSIVEYLEYKFQNSLEPKDN